MEKRAEFKVLDFTVLAKRKRVTDGQVKQTRTWERTDRQIEQERVESPAVEAAASTPAGYLNKLAQAKRENWLGSSSCPVFVSLVTSICSKYAWENPQFQTSTRPLRGRGRARTHSNQHTDKLLFQNSVCHILTERHKKIPLNDTN